MQECADEELVLIEPRVAQNFKDETVKYKSVDIAPNREKIRQAVRQRLETARNFILKYFMTADRSVGLKIFFDRQRRFVSGAKVSGLPRPGSMFHRPSAPEKYGAFGLFDGALC